MLSSARTSTIHHPDRTTTPLHSGSQYDRRFAHFSYQSQPYGWHYFCPHTGRHFRCGFSITNRRAVLGVLQPAKRGVFHHEQDGREPHKFCNPERRWACRLTSAGVARSDTSFLSPTPGTLHSGRYVTRQRSPHEAAEMIKLNLLLYLRMSGLSFLM